MVGSIRIPAHCCGVVGLKPTAGSIPTGGHCPPTVGPFSLGANFGPLARRVDDLALLYQVLAQAETGELLQSSEAGGERVVESLKNVRVAWYTNDGVSPVTEETRQAVMAAAHALAEAGLRVEEACPPGVGRGPDLWGGLFTGAVGQMLREEYRGQEELAGPLVRVLLERASEMSTDALERYFDTWAERDRLRAVLDEWMLDRPLLVAPVGSVPAFPHGARKIPVGAVEISAFRAFSYSQTFNVFGLPVVAVPAGRSPEGLPIGVQIVGRAYEEARVLAAARVVEAALGGWQSPASMKNI